MNISFRKKTLAVIVICLMMLTLLIATTIPMTATANETTNGEEPILKVDFNRALINIQLLFFVKNIGDATAHNVTFTDVNISGDVVYNNRGHISIYNPTPPYNKTNDIEPGERGYGTVDSLVVGLGVFSAIITVTCDEGTFYSDKTYGLIFGPFILIL